VSPTTGARYPLTMICAMWRVARSTVYARRADETGLNRDALGASQSDDLDRGRHPSPPAKRGPRTPLDDATLLGEIRSVLTTSGFCTEGHRKVRVRQRFRGIRVGKQRVLRLMRQANLLAPTRRWHVRGDRRRTISQKTHEV
jgi:hypothetical protein